MRKNLGVTVLALSAVFYAVNLVGWLRPLFLRMRAHGGTERLMAVVLGSLTLKGVILLTGAVLAFWPTRDDSSGP